MNGVKIVSGPIQEPPKPVAKAEIKDQGSIPYAVAKEEKTPNVETGKMFPGKKRGMGAALRGSRYTSC
jgi:hypothetical protein|tara:strand:- start:1086 stop:1289 length:204 start_codon:yes stop_codon:yes gene_type:complete